MKRATITFHAVLGMLTSTALLVAAGEPEFVIMRATIDGGGVMRSTGDDFELSGTIGQTDAGVMVGDDFELTGGFWFAIPPGDCDNNGDVDLLDHKKFTTKSTRIRQVVRPMVGLHHRTPRRRLAR